jgi:hypothetical protein
LKRIYEVWMNRWGDLALGVWNECGCHARDITWYQGLSRTNGATSMRHVRRSSRTRWLRNRGWKRLQVIDERKKK